MREYTKEKAVTRIEQIVNFPGRQNFPSSNHHNGGASHGRKLISSKYLNDVVPSSDPKPQASLASPRANSIFEPILQFFRFVKPSLLFLFLLISMEQRDWG